MSKGQGLSLNTMVIAVIAIVVLAVLIGILTGFFFDFDIVGPTKQQCSPYPMYTTAVINRECNEGYERAIGNFDLDPNRQYCCVQIEPDEPSGPTFNAQPQLCRAALGDDFSTCVNNNVDCSSSDPDGTGRDSCGETWKCCLKDS